MISGGGGGRQDIPSVSLSPVVMFSSSHCCAVLEVQLDAFSFEYSHDCYD